MFWKKKKKAVQAWKYHLIIWTEIVEVYSADLVDHGNQWLHNAFAFFSSQKLILALYSVQLILVIPFPRARRHAGKEPTLYTNALTLSHPGILKLPAGSSYQMDATERKSNTFPLNH